jgi:hypothetical protein
MAVDRRTVWVAGLLVLAIVVVLVIKSTPGPATPGASRPRPAAARAADDGGDQPLVDVRLELLQSERGEPAGPGRNPFRFQPKPAPPPPPVSKPLNSVAGTPFMPPRPAGPPPPPPIPLKFLGVVGKIVDGKVVQVAVLSDGRGVMYGGEGTIVGGQYRILKIGVESIEMAYPDGRGRQTIPMSGEK